MRTQIKKPKTTLEQKQGIHSLLLSKQLKSKQIQQRSKGIEQRSKIFEKNKNQTIESVYGKPNRFRTLRRQKDDIKQYALKNAKIQNSFNNIVINFSEQEQNKLNQLNQTDPSLNSKFLLHERKNQFRDSKERSLVNSNNNNRKNIISKVLSDHQDNEVSSLSIVIKQKTKSLDKARVSIKSNQGRYKKNKQMITLNDENQKKNILSQSIQPKNNQMVGVINKFISKFQQIINEPINLQTFQTKETKHQKKMKQTSCKFLVLLLKNKLKHPFNRIKLA